MIFRILCDVHISFKVVRFFESKGYEAVHVNAILDSYYTKDSAIANYANEHKMTVLSKDTDFKNSHFLQSKSEKLLRIALGNIPTKKSSLNTFLF